MSLKPEYNPRDIGPVCAVCGCNYLRKRPFTNRCPSCRRPLSFWIVTGLIAGLAAGWLFGQDIPQAGQIAIAATALSIATCLMLWRWAIKR